MFGSDEYFHKKEPNSLTRDMIPGFSLYQKCFSVANAVPQIPLGELTALSDLLALFEWEGEKKWQAVWWEKIEENERRQENEKGNERNEQNGISLWSITKSFGSMTYPLHLGFTS